MENSYIDYLKAFSCIRCLIPMIIIDIVIVYTPIDTVYSNGVDWIFHAKQSNYSNEQLNALCFFPIFFIICYLIHRHASYSHFFLFPRSSQSFKRLLSILHFVVWRMLKQFSMQVSSFYSKHTTHKNSLSNIKYLTVIAVCVNSHFPRSKTTVDFRFSFPFSSLKNCTKGAFTGIKPKNNIMKNAQLEIHARNCF